MSATSRRPLALANLRAFEAVARTSGFHAAADELALTQSAVSRQIKSLEDELGAKVFQRGTRHVRLTGDGALLLRAVEPALARLDAAVKQIRRGRSRRHVSVSTFASFGSLWLLPRIEVFQRQHAEIDIRVSANDALSDLDDPELDVALRCCLPADAGPGAVRLFGETVTPVVSRGYWERVQDGREPPLRAPRDLARHTCIEQEDALSGVSGLEWRHWLDAQGETEVQPRRWMALTYTYQQVQAALAGHGVALARVSMVVDALARGELLEPFGAEARLRSDRAYWRVAGRAASARPEVEAFVAWVDAEAAVTRAAIGDAA
jgi:LysR family glycine cleavage system transcriptional activator